ncbi:UPF0104 family protein [bacterium]|nr:UPF0104 family protein [bacterium]
MIKRAIQTVIAAGIALLCIVWIIAQVKLSECLIIIHHADLTWLALGTLGFGFSLAARAIRWHRVVSSTTPNLSLATTLKPLSLGYLVNNFLPGKLGEIVKAGALNRLAGVPWITSLVAILIDRISDGIGLASLVMVTWMVGPTVGALLSGIVLSGSALFVGLAILAIAVARIEWVAGMFTRLLRRLGQESRSKLLVNGRHQLRMATTPRSSLETVGLSICNWLLEGSLFWCVAAAVAIPMSFSTAIMVMGVVSFGGIILSTPAGIGSHEFLVITAMYALGYSPEHSLALGMITHLILVIPPALMGLVSAITMGTSNFKGMLATTP